MPDRDVPPFCPARSAARRREQRFVCHVALSAALACWAPAAHAEQETIALEYQVHAGCLDKQQFVARVQALTNKTQVASEGAVTRRKFSVRVLRSSGAEVGRLTVEDRGTKTTRQVSGANCDEVLAALALATAIAVDPDALGGAPSEPPAASSTPPALVTPLAPAASPSALVPRASGAATHKPARREPQLSVATGARLGGALAPFPKLEAAAELGLRRWAPLELSLGAAYGPRQHNRQIDVSEWLAWLGVSWRLVDIRRLSLFAASAVEGGWVKAVGGPEIQPSLSATRPWCALDVSLAARLRTPWTLFLQANAGLRLPLLVQRYNATEPLNGNSVELYRTGRVGYLLSLFIGVPFS
ncbi:MAG: hypothetical protein ABJB12_07905 [Pseudomonadota bacterium]